MKKFIFLFLICSLSLGFSCYAENPGFEVMLDTENSGLEISSDAAYCTYTLSPYSAEFPVFSSSNLPVAADILKFENGAAFIPLALDGGRYSICFSLRQNGNDEKYLFDFYYPDYENSENLINEINKTGNPYTVLSDSANALTPGIVVPENELKYACDFASRFAPFTAESLYNCVYGGAAVKKLADGADFNTAILPVYKYFGETSSNINSYSDATKQKLSSLLQSTGISGKTISEFYSNCVLVAKIASAESFSALKTLVTGNAEKLSINLSSNYSKLGDTKQNKLFADMLASVKSVASFGDIRTLFNECLNSADSGSTISGGGSGGSGGSGNKSSVSSPSNILNPSTIPQKDTFSDISGHWAKEFITKLEKSGAINGYPDGTFKPDNTVTRAEFSKIASISFGYNPTNETVFKDCLPGDWFNPYAAALSKAGIITGFDGYFMPESNITREDAAVILARIAEQNGVSAKSDADAGYADRNEISSYAYEYINGLSAKNIINGDENGFRPKASLSRSEAAALICRIQTLVKGE